MQAAARGLKEELGICVEAAQLAGPIVPVHLRLLEVPEVNVRDCEFVTSFRSENCSCTGTCVGQRSRPSCNAGTLYPLSYHMLLTVAHLQSALKHQAC